jgi:small-conductance mechanosensitive channel
MKKYILTIKYDENTDQVEWIQEEIIVENNIIEVSEDNISQLTSEDMIAIMEDKKYAKA